MMNNAINGIPDEFHQRCGQCECVLTLDKFRFHEGMENGRQPNCVACMSEDWIRREFGADAVFWKKEQLERQGGVCFLCGASEPGGKGGWHIHHMHSFDKKDRRGWRAVLCAVCNLWEGYTRSVGLANAERGIRLMREGKL